MGILLVAPLLAKVVHGGAVPLLWVIGIVLMVLGLWLLWSLRSTRGKVGVS